MNENSWQPKKSYELPIGAAAGGLSYSGLVSIYTLVSLVASAIISVGSLSGSEAAKYISVLVSPVAIAIVLTLTITVVKQPVRVLLPVKTRPKYYLLGVLLIFGLLFSLNYLNEYLIRLFELMGYKRRPSFVPDVSGWRIVPALICVAVIPAIFEEIMFRGILLVNAEEGVGSVRAILLSGFCFSLYHGSVEQTVYQFICGCLFALLAIRSRSVLPTVIIHFLNNAAIIILMACGLVDANGAMIMSKTAEIIISVLSAVCLIGAVVWLVLDKKLLKRQRFGGVKQFFIFAAVGIAVMALMWIINLF